jgi:uncharacterized protein (TIGR03118 family)
MSGTRTRNFTYTIGPAALFLFPVMACASYIQTNLVSDVSGLATFTDPNLKNPWGMSAGPTSPFWVSDQATGLSTLYNAVGLPQALVVTIPPSGLPPQGPTGQVFNSTAASFAAPVGGKALFLFSTLGGTIEGWNGGSGTTAQVLFTATDRAAYTGLALATSGGNDFLFAADFANAKIDVFNSTFVKQVLGAGAFTDPNLPAGYSPYNVQNINGKIYVEYALVDPVTHRASTIPNTGIVDVFDTSGGSLQRLVTLTHLDSPWGIALAPAGFGQFGGDLLVGNFGDGRINAFDPISGGFLGTVSDANGNPLLNSGLWALSFHAAAPGFDPNVLYFNAGINNEADGLFGTIQAPTPEPSTFALLTICIAASLMFRRKLIRARQ